MLSRLEAAERAELNPHLQCDYRIAWITARKAARDVPQPHVMATYAVLGLHPDKVWPAIVERRKAKAGPLYEQFFGEKLPPKKPAGSVRLLEDVVERRVGEEVRSRSNTARNLQNFAPGKTSVESPQMAASTVGVSHNPNGGKSGNPSRFSLRQLVESSTWPALYRALLLAMLDKNRFGTELYRSQRKLSREFGVSYSTVRRMIDRLERGHQFGRTNIVRCEGVLSLAIPPNMRPGGKLRRTATYELHPHRLAARMTEQQYEESSAGALCPFPPTSSHAAPPAPTPQPKAEPQHRSTQRETPAQPKLTKRECSKLVADVVTMMRGSSGLTPNSPGRFDPMNFRAALAHVCRVWKRAPESVAESLKFWGFKFEESEGP